MSAHVFDTEVATKVGLNAAVIYENIRFWCEKNAANGRHFHDGEWWTYNSSKAFLVLFPYLTEKQIRGAIDALISAGLVRTGNYNESAYDRTRWFCLPGYFHLPCRANQSAPQGGPIPDTKPDTKPDTPPYPVEDGQFDLLSNEEGQSKDNRFSEFWNVYPKKAGKPAAAKAWAKAIRRGDAQKIIDAARRYAASEAVLRGFAKHPQGWLNDDRWLDVDLQPVRESRVTRPWGEVVR